MLFLLSLSPGISRIDSYFFRILVDTNVIRRRDIKNRPLEQLVSGPGKGPVNKCECVLGQVVVFVVIIVDVTTTEKQRPLPPT